MSYFATADQHFGHGSILRHANRPFATVEEMDAALAANWNELVGPGDTVWILGDFAWRNHASYLNRLHGKKVLVCGSHDRMPQEALAQFAEVHRGGAMANLGNQRLFWCSHTCNRVWERCHYGVPHLFGHSHGRLITFNMSVDVGVDSTFVTGRKYYPFSVDEIMACMARREEEMRRAGRIKPGGVGGKELYRQDDVWWVGHQGEGG